jgi:hypothetical protein
MPTTPPPTRIISWRQMVLEADPGWTRASVQPVVYEFSNGRVFLDYLPLYGTSTAPPPADPFTIGVSGIGGPDVIG